MTAHVEQPMPTPNSHPSIQSLVRADLEQREQVGISRYGTALQPHNGRDALRDGYEEALDLACYLRQAMVERDSRPHVVCISGSMRFEDEMHLAAVEESLAGHIVVMPHVNMKRPLPVTLHALATSDTVKSALDVLHFDKIRLADEVLVVARDGYVGDSTRAEIAYAESIGKPVRYWLESLPVASKEA
jgi:hypothetical protein